MPSHPLVDHSMPELATGRPRSLVIELGEALERHDVLYCCQWKGSWKKRRWMSGQGDIDLLVERGTEPHFTAVLENLGFRRATPPWEAQVAGLESCFGLDRATGRLITCTCTTSCSPAASGPPSTGCPSSARCSDPRPITMCFALRRPISSCWCSRSAWCSATNGATHSPATQAGSRPSRESSTRSSRKPSCTVWR